jgi:choline dehydrogenase
MPYVTNGNIYAPVIMLAEKAADLIAGNAPLAPDRLPFYRHGTGMPLEDPSRTPTGEPAGVVS